MKIETLKENRKKLRAFDQGDRITPEENTGTALQFIAKIDQIIDRGASSDTLWNYCVENRTRAFQDAIKNAAAPELLAALKAMLEDYEELARNHSGAWHEDEVLLHCRIGSEARSAIKKATI